MADKKYRIVIEITETYERRDEEEGAEYRKAIHLAMKMARSQAGRALRQVLGKSVSISVKTEVLKE